MSIVLFGSTEITLIIAEYLYENNIDIAAIVTVPETFSISYSQSGVKNSRYVNIEDWAKKGNIKAIQFTDNRQLMESLKAIKSPLQLGIVAGWYHMIPSYIRDLFQQGCIGFHASLLPELRGGAPLNWAILLGKSKTGVSCFELSDGIDDGYLYDQESFSIEPGDYIQDLIRKAEKAIITMLNRSLIAILNEKIDKQKQLGTPSYTGQRQPSDSEIDWPHSSEAILRLIRASSMPYSGAYSFLKDEKIIIWKAEIADITIHACHGQIITVDNNVYVQCGINAIKITESNAIQRLKSSNQQRLTHSSKLTDQ